MFFNYLFKIDYSKFPYLHKAAQSSNSNIHKYFLSRKLIDVNAVDFFWKIHLMPACQAKQKKNIEFLFEIDDFDYLNQDNIGKDALIIEIKKKVQYLNFFLSS